MSEFESQSGPGKKELIIERLRRERGVASPEVWPSPAIGQNAVLFSNTGLQQRIQRDIFNAIIRLCAGETDVKVNIPLRSTDSGILVREVEKYAEECLASRAAADEIEVNILQPQEIPEPRPTPGYLSLYDFRGILKRAERQKNMLHRGTLDLRRRDAGLFISDAARKELIGRGMDKNQVMIATRDSLGLFLGKLFGIVARDRF